MRRTTEQWEALLNGTTPGPWEVYDEDSTMILSDGTPVLDINPDWYPHDPRDVRLASVVPESVAEVIRLQKAIIALRDDLAAPDDPDDDYGHGMEAAYQSAATALTRILEGDTDE